MKIAVIIPYFGQLPSYFPYFLWSSRYNPQLTYFFFSDQPEPNELTETCRWFTMTFGEMQDRIQNRLQIDASSLTPYKLCDYRPTYAFLFEEYIRDSNWWGFGDVDVILGDLSKYVSESDLEKYDVISFREDWVSGSLTLIRNNQPMNSLYKKIANYDGLLNNSKHLGIDEVSFQYDTLRNIPWTVMNWPYDNFTRVIKEAELNGLIKTRFRTDIKEYLHPNEWVTVSSKGVFDQDGKEYAYYHMVNEKKRYFFDTCLPVNPEINYFGHSGVVSSSQIRRVQNVHRFRKIRHVFKGMSYLMTRVSSKLQ